MILCKQEAEYSSVDVEPREDYQSYYKLYGGKKLLNTSLSGQKKLLPLWPEGMPLLSNPFKISRTILSSLTSSSSNWVSPIMIY
jgi:hypothetical protein